MKNTVVYRVNHHCGNPKKKNLDLTSKFERKTKSCHLKKLENVVRQRNVRKLPIQLVTKFCWNFYREMTINNQFTIFFLPLIRRNNMNLSTLISELDKVSQSSLKSLPVRKFLSVLV